MQRAKIIVLSVILVLSSASFCSASTSETAGGEVDIDKIKDEVITFAVKFWNEIGRPAWDGFAVWCDNTAKPWLEENTSQETKDEFNKESKEVVSEAPGALKSIWDKIVELIK